MAYFRSLFGNNGVTNIFSGVAYNDGKPEKPDPVRIVFQYCKKAGRTHPEKRTRKVLREVFGFMI